MKTLFVNNGGNMTVDTETNEIGSLNSCREAISRIYMIEENMNVIVKNGDKNLILKAEAGDLLVVFYENSFETPAVLVKNKEWKDNIEGYNRKMQKEKEEWAARKAGNSKIVNEEDIPCCDCCESSK